MRKSLFLLALTAITLTLLTGVASAAEKTYVWDRLDVDITVLRNSDLRIVERQQFTYTSGTFHFGYRSIPMDRLESITNVEVWEGERRYKKSNSGQPYTFKTWIKDNEFHIRWFYPGYHDSCLLYTSPSPRD